MQDNTVSRETATEKHNIYSAAWEESSMHANYHSREAAKYHAEAALHFKAGNKTMAADSAAKAYFHHCMATKHKKNMRHSTLANAAAF